MIFRYQELENFLKKLAVYNKVSSFKEMENEKQGTILRHDVDADVKAAFNIVQIEKSINVKSTLFFLTSSPCYNVNTFNNRKLIRKIAEDGFEVGLHLDLLVYPHLKEDEDFELVALKEASILEDIIGVKIETYSIHNPSIHGQYPSFKTLRNAYASKFFKPELYLSDSRMNFRGKDPFEFAKLAINNLIQVTLHPIHFSESGGGYEMIFKEYIGRVISDIDENFRSVNKYYVEALENKTLISLVQNK